MILKYCFSSIDADYYQFHLQDADAPGGSLANAWITEAFARNVAVAPFIVGIETKRNTSVWLDLEVHDTEPKLEITKNLVHLVECSLDIPSGKLFITSPTLSLSDSYFIDLPPSCYRLRIYFGKLSQRGTHRYKVFVWQKANAPVKVIEAKPKTFAIV